MTIIKHATNPAIFVGTSDEFDTAQDGEFSASGLWFFYVCGKEGGLACLSAEDAMQAGEKEFFRRTENEIRDFLHSEVYALKQRLACQIVPVAAPEHDDALGDWMVEGVFETNEPYSGPLSGLGLSLTCFAEFEGAPLGYRFDALPGYRPLMDEAYEALAHLKAAQPVSEVCQPWTRWIINALKRDHDIVTLESANDSWLELAFGDHIGEAIHIEQSCCADSMEVSRLDMNGNNSYLEHVEMWIEDISNQARLAIKGQITACLHPYRFKGGEYLAFDLDGAEGSFSLTFMAGQPYELNDITPWVPDMSEALAMAAAVALRLDALVKFSPGLRVDRYETF
ncbi:hypothetical protein NLO85_22100 [Pseudomonas savastanoi]|uniref:Uncharacterized protein n=4 Tax=Pseudomonas syringae group TaxID=136849 RepID=A0AAW5JD04_PSESS|nr:MULTISPECIES: hypothetical protein [Pseudomonas syringae group]KWT12093.1 hypothetical protein AL046_14060 [Pseudomonas syringae pv. avii]MCQ3023190.1 hypothetical protein [Pseudomonas savastanoi]PHN54593.1 hypothetical protein AO286_09245 [Pseudomonas syringae]POP99284.1 hypothetical protein CXB40_25780 [Pseudomonas syringae pv. avii]